MTLLRNLCLAMCTLALGVWIGVNATSAIAAAIMFPRMHELDPVLPGFGAYTGEHWLVAGGVVMNRIFQVTALIGAVAGGIATGTFALPALVLRPGRFPARTTLLTGIVFLALLGVTVWTRVLLREMDETISAFFEAASLGDNERAEMLRGSFDAMHPKVSTRLSVETFLALVSFGLGAVCMMKRDTLFPVRRKGPS